MEPRGAQSGKNAQGEGSAAVVMRWPQGILKSVMRTLTQLFATFDTNYFCLPLNFSLKSDMFWNAL